MGKKISMVGIDPALRNVGLAHALYDLDTNSWTIERVVLVKTEPDKSKQVRKSSDDLACARQMLQGIQDFVAATRAQFTAAEIPTGTQSARGSIGNGICIGVLASLPLVIEVSPTEVKMASVGIKAASKAQMIQWAVAAWPNAGWLTKKLRGEVSLTADNEHLADACAAIAAAVRTPTFGQALQMLRANAAVNLALAA